MKDMLELMASYMPYVAAPVIIFEAQSFDWIYSFLLEQYGYKRSDEALTIKFAQTHPKETGRKTKTNQGSSLVGCKLQKDSPNRCEEKDSAVKHNDQENTAGVVLLPRQPIQTVPYNRFNTELERFNTEPENDLAVKAKDNPAEKVMETHSEEEEMRVTNRGREAAPETEPDNEASEAQINTLDRAQTAQGTARRQTDSGQTSLSDVISRVRADIQACATNHWARLSNAHIPDRKGGPGNRQGTASPQGPQARPTSEDTSTPGLSPLAQATPNDNPQHEEEPAPRGREGIPQRMTHRRFIRTTGISAMRDAASVWSSFLNAYRHS